MTTAMTPCDAFIHLIMYFFVVKRIGNVNEPHFGIIDERFLHFCKLSLKSCAEGLLILVVSSFLGIQVILVSC